AEQARQARSELPALETPPRAALPLRRGRRRRQRRGRGQGHPPHPQRLFGGGMVVRGEPKASRELSKWIENGKERAHRSKSQEKLMNASTAQGPPGGMAGSQVARPRRSRGRAEHRVDGPTPARTERPLEESPRTE